MKDKIYVGEWNNKQQCPHCEEFEDYQKECFNHVIEGTQQDWILVTIGTHQQVHAFLSELERTLKGKSKK